MEFTEELSIFEVGEPGKAYPQHPPQRFTQGNKKNVRLSQATRSNQKENKSNHHEYYFSAAITFAVLNESFALLNRSNAFSHSA